jgi:tRNA dimethylallyltransferase
MERKVIVLVGPTCSGKTRVGISLAEKMQTEIISADSRQIYKHLNIGTAKPTVYELKKVKHQLIDCFEPDVEYNVSKFENDALDLINGIHSVGKIPIIVGGSGLYVKSLVDGLFNTVDVDVEYREELRILRETHGNDFLYDRLKKIDPESASKMLPQNWKRVMRALEVFHLTGEPIWKFHGSYSRNTDMSFIQFGLNWERATLYKNIELRVDGMIANGLVDETKFVLEKGYSKKINALNTVGYKEIIYFLENEITLERAIELIKRNTRHFAKRQMTWFRKDERIKWLQITSESDLDSAAQIILKDFS